MNWNLIPNSVNTGKFNMEFDIELARQCKGNNCYLRLYQWDPYCISLGANQSVDDIDTEHSAGSGIDIVKRPTGGRAILHAEEITYSVILPTTIGISAKELYREVSIALINGLSLYDNKLKSLSLEADQPHFPSLLKGDSGKLCFGSTARNEIKFNGKKVVGSAQRKMNDALLQHGSILCGPFHRRLVEFIRKSDTSYLDLTNSTTELAEIIGREINYTALSECLVKGFEKSFEINFNNFDESKMIDLPKRAAVEFSN